MTTQSSSAETSVTFDQTSGWIAAASITGFSLFIILAMFWETAASMATVWYNSSTFGHGFLVVPISAYLIWSSRAQLTNLSPAPTLLGLPLLAIFGLVWLVGNVSEVLLVEHLALIGIVQVLIWTMIGTSAVRAMLFPIAFLIFAVPMGEGLIRPLQDATAFLAVAALRMSGIPVFQEGVFITIPQSAWQVAEECSAIRYVIPGVVLGAVFSYLTYRSYTRRLLFVVGTVLAVILVNGLRVYAIIGLTHISDRSALASIGARAIEQMYGHLGLGWLMFSIAMLILFWAGSRWREPETVSRVPSVETAIPAAPMWRSTGLAIAAVALVALAPAAVMLRGSNNAGPLTVVIDTLEAEAPWTENYIYTGNWSPHFIGADKELKATYTTGEQTVHLYIAYYAQREGGAELINGGNTLVDEPTWELLSDNSTTIRTEQLAVAAREDILRSATGTRRLVQSWYWIGDEFTANPYYAKLLQAKSWLLNGSRSIAIIAIAADFDDDAATAASSIQDFLERTKLIQDAGTLFSAMED
jgi:exosortase A